MSVKKYRKLPVVIEAIQFLYDHDHLEKVSDFCGSKLKFEFPTVEKYAPYFIDTLEGRMRVNHEDYIIKGVRGEFYPCKKEIFEETYQEVLND